MKLQQILVNSNLYKNNDSLFNSNEISFQNVVMQQLPIYLGNDLDKNIMVYKCNHKFWSDYGNAKPDLIAISEDYNYYSIIEVELSHHSWESHVARQVKCLVNAEYSNQKEKIFKNICNTNLKNQLDEMRFYKMIDDVEPEFMIVAEKYDQSWEAKLAHFKTRYITMSSHINEMNDFSFLINDCRVIKKIDKFPIEWNKYFFKFKERGNEYFKNESTVSIRFREDEYIFSVGREVDGIYLSPMGSLNITDKVAADDLFDIEYIECKGKSFELF